ncbi:MAG: hypothetical protein ACJASV_002550, partial [Pseudorhodobacter sp.]
MTHYPSTLHGGSYVVKSFFGCRSRDD